MFQRCRAFLFCLIACCAVLPVVAVAATEKPTVTVDRAMSFRALKHTAYLEFRWKRYPKPAAFKMYTIVRSEPDGPTAPEAGDIVATTTNRYSTNVEDRPPHQGIYYYRLCVTKKDGHVVCSKAIKVVYEGLITTKAAQATEASFVDARMIVPPAVPTATRSLIPILDADMGEMQLTLHRHSIESIEKYTFNSMPVALSWTPAQQHDVPPQKYILVRSFTNSTLAYPADGYLAKLADVTASSFVDTVYVAPEMVNAPRWYRVCAIDAAQGIRCGAPALFAPNE